MPAPGSLTDWLARVLEHDQLGAQRSIRALNLPLTHTRLRELAAGDEPTSMELDALELLGAPAGIPKPRPVAIAKPRE